MMTTRVLVRVYIVRDGALQTVAVFSNRDKAAAFISRQEHPGRYDIEEMAVDE